MMNRFLRSPLLWPLLVWGFILLLNLIFSPSFFEIEMKNGNVYGTLIDIALRAAPLVLVSIGMTFVIATGGIDLSVGAVAALASSSVALALTSGFDWHLALAFGLIAGLGWGAINAVLIQWLGLQPIVASLIAMVGGRGLAQLLLNGQIVSLVNPVLSYIGSGWLFGFPMAIWIALATLVIMNLLARKTSMGLFIEALGANREASRFIGLNPRKIGATVYLISGLAAAMAGIVMSTNIRAVDVNNLGNYLELDAILAVVIGGTRLNGGRFSLFGTALGALIIQTVTTTINTQGIAVESMLIVKAAVVIGICLIQSDAFRADLSRLNPLRVKQQATQMKEAS